jgi:hypothetical protein
MYFSVNILPSIVVGLFSAPIPFSFQVSILIPHEKW